MEPPPPSARAPVVVAYERGTLRVSGLPTPLPPLGVPLVPDARVQAHRTDAMHHRTLLEALVRAGLTVEDQVARPLSLAFPAAALHDLRPEQKDAVRAWEAADRRGVVVMPTGTGKTVVALHAIQRAGVATLVVAPVRDLMYQWQRRIQDGLGVDAGLVGDQHHNIQPVTVATYDSAYLHMDKMGDRFGLIIFDEAHHLPSRTTREAALMCTARARLGLTATPERSDGRHTDLLTLVGPTVFQLAMPDVAGRSLAEYDVVRVPVTLTPEEQVRYDAACAVLRQHLAERRREDPTYTFEDLSRESGADPAARAAQKAYYARKSMEDRAAEKLRVLEDILSLHAGERVLVFTGSNAMAMEISRRFLVPTLLSFSRKKERHAVLAGFAAGQMPVLVANQVLDEGVDIPECKVAVVLGGMSSVRQAKQRLGRILRRSGGQKATLYEVVTRDTGEEQRSRDRRRSDAYGRARQSTL